MAFYGTLDGSIDLLVNSNPSIRPTLDLNFAQSKTLDPRVTFYRDSLATYVDSLGIIRTVPQNVPRFDHDPTTGESIGLLLEENRTNLLTYSEQFNDSSWTKGYSSVSANQVVSPDGLTTADKLVEDTTANVQHSLYKSRTGSNETVTFSVFAKAAERTKIYIQLSNFLNAASYAVCNLSTGVVETLGPGGADYTNVSASMVPYPNGWYRCILTSTKGNANNNNIPTISPYTTTTAYTGNGTSGIYIWGAQLETGTFASSYIPTIDSSVTRSADYADITGTNFSSWFNPLEGTFIAECDRGNDGTEGAGIGAARRPLDAYYDMIQFGEFYDNGGSTGRIYAGNGSPSTAEAVINAVHTTGQGIYNKYSFAYKTNDAFGAINGVSQGNDTSVTLPTGLDRFLFGSYSDGRANSNLDGHIKRFMYYNKRLTDSQILNLTSL